MTIRHPQSFPGQRHQDRRYEMPPPDIPKNHLSWFSKVMMAFAAILLVGLVIGFWRAASPPDEVPASQTPAANDNQNQNTNENAPLVPASRVDDPARE